MPGETIINETPEIKDSNKSVIGIIYPPPEVRNIVDKTASFVARNGPEFEARICHKEQNNPKFNFLHNGDPYNSYYQHKVKEFREGKLAIEAAPNQSFKAKADAQKIPDRIFIPKEPPPEFEYVADPPSISGFDLDVVKLTAQFVSRNGRQFLTNLMNREQRNYHFDFLRPQHSLFPYFTKLLEQYTKILIPPKDVLSKLMKDATDAKSILEQVEYRVQWTKLVEARKRREEEEAERERLAYSQIDWHDFVIVETVDYQAYEQGLFPPPTIPEEVGSRLLAQERFEGGDVEMEVDSDGELSEIEAESRNTNIDNTQVQDMEEDSSSEDEGVKPRKNDHKHVMPPPPSVAPPSKPQPPPLPPNPEQVLIRKDYDPKSAKPPRAVATSGEYLISPITGEKIPVNKVQEHMRIGLLDPRWVEQRDRAMQEKMQQEEVYAAGSSIETSLKQLAERRTDIFGIGDEETAIGKKIGEEDKKREDKVTWDGHTASMEAATRAARANITIEEQIHQIHKVKGLLPDEEKERIGPSKPMNAAAIQMAQLSKPPVSMVHGTHSAPPSLTSVHAMASLTAPGMMLMPPRPLGPPPTMLGEGGELLFPYGLPPRPPMPPGIHSHVYPTIPAPPVVPPLPPDDEPLSKKQKTEENLIPETEFLRKNPSQVTFKVLVPNMADKSDWKLNGQTLSITLPLTETIATVKSKINEQLGMPPGKQKLQFEGLFFKDSNSLAFYNIQTSTQVQLQPKERGGRKK